MAQTSNKEFNQIIEQLGWSLGRTASALDVRQDDVIAWQQERRGVPDRIFSILSKYVEIHEGKPSERARAWRDRAQYAESEGESQWGDERVNADQSHHVRRLERAYKELASAHYELLRSLPQNDRVSFGPYAVLGVLPGAPWEEIRSSYRALSKIHHPDRGGDQDVMQSITEAYADLRLLFGK